jgi:uncharacterized protein (TIGR00251 family)
MDKKFILAVRVSTGARKSELVGYLDDGRFKIRVAAPPLDGKANAALIALFASALGVSRNQISILSGAGSRDKRLEIRGIDEREFKQRLRST